MTPKPKVFGNPLVYFDLCLGGRLVFELYRDLVPKTCENFLQICTKGVRDEFHFDPLTPVAYYTYKDTAFHRISKGFMAQGGDVLNTNGKSNLSTYTKLFELELPVGRAGELRARGKLCMANAGLENTTGSQFFITFVPTPWLEGRHVAVGELISGFDVLDKLELAETAQIVACGELT